MYWHLWASVPYAPLYKLCDISFNNYLNITKDSQIWSPNTLISTHICPSPIQSLLCIPYQSQKTSKLLCSLKSSVSPFNCIALSYPSELHYCQILNFTNPQPKVKFNFSSWTQTSIQQSLTINSTFKLLLTG